MLGWLISCGWNTFGGVLWKCLLFLGLTSPMFHQFFELLEYLLWDIWSFSWLSRANSQCLLSLLIQQYICRTFDYYVLIQLLLTRCWLSWVFSICVVFCFFQFCFVLFYFILNYIDYKARSPSDDSVWSLFLELHDQQDWELFHVACLLQCLSVQNCLMVFCSLLFFLPSPWIGRSYSCY